jgi:hypothetical protein
MKEEALTTPTYRGPNPAWIYPVRSPVDWSYRGERIVLVYPKNLNRFERALKKFIGGPDDIMRPLDEVGTLLWEMSDGEHSLLEIFISQQKRYREKVEPVDKVVGGLLETMLKLGLIRLEFHPGGKGSEQSGREGKKVNVRETED